MCIVFFRDKESITLDGFSFVSHNRQELRGGRYRTCIGQSQWNVKYRSRAPGQGACLKSMSMTITMQGFTLAAINDAEKTKLRSNFEVKICKVNGP